MDRGREFLDLIVRSDGGFFIGASPRLEGLEQLSLTGQIVVGEVALPAFMEVPLDGAPRRGEEDRSLRLIRMGDATLDVVSHGHVDQRDLHSGTGMPHEEQIDVHTLVMAGEGWDCRATAVVDPLPVLPIFAVVALVGYAIHKRSQGDEMRNFREQWERDKRDCLDSGGFPQARIRGSGKWEVNLTSLEMSLDPRVGYDFRCVRD